MHIVYSFCIKIDNLDKTRRKNRANTIQRYSFFNLGKAIISSLVIKYSNFFLKKWEKNSDFTLLANS